MADSKQLKIKLIKSTIGAPKRARDCVRSLGLRRLQHEVLRPDNAAVRGLIHKINHLLAVEEA